MDKKRKKKKKSILVGETWRCLYGIGGGSAGVGWGVRVECKHFLGCCVAERMEQEERKGIFCPVPSRGMNE